jgi:hypothetical protein
MGKNVKIIPAGSQQRTRPNADAARRAENQRIAASQSRMQAMKTQAQLGVGHIDRVDGFKDVPKRANRLRTSSTIVINSAVDSAPRTTAGVTPKTSTVARLFRPSRGGGLGGIMGNKQR